MRSASPPVQHPSIAASRIAHLAHAAPTTPLQIAAGQGLWCHLGAGSTVYCATGRVQISSPWVCALALSAEDAPYCIGAHAGWYWLEATAHGPAQLLLTARATSGWASLWQDALCWLGMRSESH